MNRDLPYFAHVIYLSGVNIPKDTISSKNRGPYHASAALITCPSGFSKI